MLVKIIHDCGAAFVLTSQKIAAQDNIIKVVENSPVPWHCEMAIVKVAEETSGAEPAVALDQAKPDDIPFLLYTSGSTSMFTYTTITSMYIQYMPIVTLVINVVLVGVK